MATQQPPFPFPMAGWLTWRTFINKTANYSIKSADNGTYFTNKGAVGAVTYTLPAIAPNYRFFFAAIADQNLLVTSREGTNIVAFNNASASTLAFQTAGARIGGGLIFQSNEDGTKWYVQNASVAPSANALTIS